MSDNIRVGLVVAGTIDKAMVRTVAQTWRYGKQTTDTFNKASKQLAATGAVLRFIPAWAGNTLYGDSYTLSFMQRNPELVDAFLRGMMHRRTYNPVSGLTRLWWESH